MESKVILNAVDLDGYLTEGDQAYLAQMDGLFNEALRCFKAIEGGGFASALAAQEKRIISLYNEMGHLMQTICKDVPGLKVFSFETEEESHAEASRVIAKLRDIRTDNHEFIYYSQRAYEMLFKLAFTGNHSDSKNYLVVKTPVTSPVQNYSVHKIPDIDHRIENTVMCVMLRGALLPSMIMSKEIEEYSSHGYVTPFALFKIKRDETRSESDMQYVLDLQNSFFNPADLHDRDLIFADPMNATGGSLVTVVSYLQSRGVTPRSIKFFNVITALKGGLRVVRALDNCTCYTLWMDPALNSRAYIMPGLGDAGDRLNGRDSEDTPRNIIQLIADYGSNIADLYRSQLRKIEQTVLGKV
ncbi:MAG: uracil phosphoribosyltransferase [Spirochaetaceae bacterium]|jgi:uracil phosphoribosyltransferase|nr:uracil phosphoribosyltransferase [Spirochaetaceae bacterium]